MSKNQWVSPRENGWAVHGEGNKHDTKLFSTQAEAQKFAIGIAKKQHSEVIVQKTNGTIRSKDSYGNDPCPAKTENINYRSVSI